MVQQCWHYKYNDTIRSPCSGTFDQCATRVDCASEGQNYPACFALALVENQQNGTGVTILSSGCFESVEHCDTECLGMKRRTGKYYCCCTTNGCNNKLIPEIIPPSAANNVDNNASLPHFPVDQQQQHQRASDQNSSYTLPVIVIIALVSLAATFILAIYIRRARLKRKSSGPSRSNRRSCNDNPLNYHNRHEPNDMRTNPDALVPFRNSFGDDTNHHFHYGQHELHRNDNNNLTNFATRMNNHNDGGLNNNHIINQEPIDLKRVKLLDIVGSGRFGTVHKATLFMSDSANTGVPRSLAAASSNTDTAAIVAETEISSEKEKKQLTSEIAVKIIPNNEFQSYQNELRIYSSPRTRHPNVLTFLGSTESPSTNSHWLLVEYASNGSLHHYLKGNTVTWSEFLSISLGIVRGLSHLHDADIAHRDFKSKNVLLRHNLSPCITDFGVASMLDAGSGGSQQEQRKKFLQVGTPRYMAPEVLECSVAFTKISFTKIDVYALSLVLWELLSRCHPLPKSRLNHYDDIMVVSSPSYARAHDTVFAAFYTHQSPSQPLPAPTLLTSCPPRSPPSNQQKLDRQKWSANNFRHSQLHADAVAEEAEEAHVGLLKQAHSSIGEPPMSQDTDGDDVADSARPSDLVANGLEASIELSEISTSGDRETAPVYKMPFEDAVGPNPDINTMRQAVVTEKLRPPIRAEWRFYPLSKLCQAIVDGWEYDHDARISASCFVERIETLQQQLLQQVQQQQQQQQQHQPPLHDDGPLASCEQTPDVVQSQQLQQQLAVQPEPQASAAIMT